VGSAARGEPVRPPVCEARDSTVGLTPQRT
jgi:hypothetical protein